MTWYAYDGGKIVARYEHPHSGLVQRADDHPDVVAFLTPPPFIPQEVSRFQAKEALRRINKLADANAAVAASGDAQLQLAWSEAPNFPRNSPGLNALAPALGLSQADLDQLFITAAGIRA